MCDFHYRTDLALEARESVSESETELRGVSVKEFYMDKEDIRITKVCIETRNASRILGKPMGHYITIEAPCLTMPDEGYHLEVSKVISKELRHLLPEKEEQSILVVGLGNRDVTADSLGPRVIDNLCITRHVVKEYGKAALDYEAGNLISSIEPGVMAKTGMESAEIIKGVIHETNPDVLIVVDALAARSSKRLNRTIQISNTGIWPGSGVGNHRLAITQESLGIPVIAIGIPTVVDAATIVRDAFDKMREEQPLDALKFSELNNMYMTGKDIDGVIKLVSFTLSEGINMALNCIY